MGVVPSTQGPRASEIDIDIASTSTPQQHQLECYYKENVVVDENQPKLRPFRFKTVGARSNSGKKNERMKGTLKGALEYKKKCILSVLCAMHRRVGALSPLRALENFHDIVMSILEQTPLTKRDYVVCLGSSKYRAYDPRLNAWFSLCVGDKPNFVQNTWLMSDNVSSSPGCSIPKGIEGMHFHRLTCFGRTLIEFSLDDQEQYIAIRKRDIFDGGERRWNLANIVPLSFPKMYIGPETIFSPTQNPENGRNMLLITYTMNGVPVVIGTFDIQTNTFGKWTKGLAVSTNFCYAPHIAIQPMHMNSGGLESSSQQQQQRGKGFPFILDVLGKVFKFSQSIDNGDGYDSPVKVSLVAKYIDIENNNKYINAVKKSVGIAGYFDLEMDMNLEGIIQIITSWVSPTSGRLCCIATDRAVRELNEKTQQWEVTQTGLLIEEIGGYFSPWIHRFYHIPLVDKRYLFSEPCGCQLESLDTLTWRVEAHCRRTFCSDFDLYVVSL